MQMPHGSTDLRENGRIILAHGEVTGHCHEVVSAVALDIPQAQFFESPDGQRHLIVLGESILTHQDHDHFRLWPDGSAQKVNRVTGQNLSGVMPAPAQCRQGDILLHPTGTGTWRVIRQRQQTLDEIRQVAD
jgi:hypothetical protein